MSNSELIRWGIAVLLLAVVISRRMGLFDRFKEKRLEEEKKATQERLKVQRQARQEELQRQAEVKKRQTAEILRQSLHGMEQKSMQLAGQEVWYAEGGTAGDAPSVVLVHGFAGDKENWDAVAQHLLKQGLHVVAPDLPGFGQSDKNPELPYDITHQAKRLRALVHRLGIQRAHWVGHSMGGAIVSAIAYGVPAEVATLTLVEPFGVRVPAESELDTLLARGLNPLVIAAPTAYDNLLGFLYHHPPEMSQALKTYRAEEAAKHRVFHLKVWQQVRGGDQAFLLDALLPEIQLRTLALQGHQSRVVHPSTPQAIESMMANAQGRSIDDCGHMVMVEKPEEMATHLLDFLGLSKG